MQLNFDKDDFNGDAMVVKDPRGGWGIALALHTNGVGHITPEGTEVWGTLTLFGDVRALLRKAAAALDLVAGEAEGLIAVKAVLEALPAGTLGYIPTPIPPYKVDLIPEALKGLSNTIAKSNRE